MGERQSFLRLRLMGNSYEKKAASSFLTDPENKLGILTVPMSHIECTNLSRKRLRTGATPGNPTLSSKHIASKKNREDFFFLVT